MTPAGRRTQPSPCALATSRPGSDPARRQSDTRVREELQRDEAAPRTASYRYVAPVIRSAVNAAGTVGEERRLPRPTTVEWEPVPPWPMPTDLAALLLVDQVFPFAVTGRPNPRAAIAIPAIAPA